MNKTAAPAKPSQYERIVDALVVRRRTLHEPVKLPTEEQLARHYNIARNTLRRAMEVLEHRGAVTRRRGRGTYLMPLRPVASARLEGGVIGLVMPWWVNSIHEWYIAAVVDGVMRSISDGRFQLSFLSAGRLESDEHKFLERVAAHKLVGLIWVHPVPTQSELLQAVARHLPCVVVGREYAWENILSITPDYEAAAALIDQHLIDRGHEKYVVISKSPADPFGESWLRGFDEATRRRGIHFDYTAYYLDMSPFKSDHNEMAAVLKLYLKCQPDVTACVLTTSSYLVHLLPDAQVRAWVPNQLSMVAFDYGIQAMNTYWPGRRITHVRCHWDKIGRRAMDLLAYQLENHEAPPVTHEEIHLEPGDTVIDRKNAAACDSLRAEGEAAEGAVAEGARAVPEADRSATGVST